MNHVRNGQKEQNQKPASGKWKAGAESFGLRLLHLAALAQVDNILCCLHYKQVKESSLGGSVFKARYLILKVGEKKKEKSAISLNGLCTQIIFHVIPLFQNTHWRQPPLLGQSILTSFFH